MHENLENIVIKSPFLVYLFYGDTITMDRISTLSNNEVILSYIKNAST